MINKNLITYQSIKSAYDRMGYKFRREPYMLNIFSIRSSESQSNKFDDLTVGFYHDSQGECHILIFDSTTDPGKYWLQNPSNREGTAILVPGQYLDVYVIGIHGRTGSNPYEAFEQIDKMKYVRDNNKDMTLDFGLMNDAKNIFWANIKSNIHRASKNILAQLVEKYSAACQVIQSASNFESLLNAGKKQVLATGKKTFDYTLFTEVQFFG